MELAQHRGVGVIAGEALATGLLSGNASKLVAADVGLDESEFQERLWRAQQFRFLATNTQSLAQAALRYVLACTGVSSLIVGMLKPSHLAENLAALQHPKLTTAEMDRISQLQGLAQSGEGLGHDTLMRKSKSAGH